MNRFSFDQIDKLAYRGAWTGFWLALVVLVFWAAARSGTGAVANATTLQPVNVVLIGDLIWQDANLDGLREPTESGIDGVLVNIWADVNGNFTIDPADDLIDSMLSGDDPSTPELEHGWYRFTVLPSRTYFVEIDDANFVVGGPLHQMLYTGESVQGLEPRVVIVFAVGSDDVDFGYARTGIDLVKTAGQAADGQPAFLPAGGGPVTFAYTLTNTGEASLIDVTLTDDNGTPGDPGDDFTVCSFLGPIDAGSTQVCAHTLTLTTDHTNVATVIGTPVDGFFNSGLPVQDQDEAQVSLPTALGDRVWFDQNGNGLQDAGEPGQAAITLHLFSADGQPVGQQTTNAQGLYAFSDLLPGVYYLTVDLPVGFSVSPANQGADDELDSDLDPVQQRTELFALAGGADNSWDVGLLRSGVVGDRIWLDQNGNGLQDAGEPGLAQVPVHLVTTDGQVLASVVSDAQGHYEFSGVGPGQYRIRVQRPLGYQFTLSAQGGDDEVDSDVLPATGETALVTLSPGDSLLTLDAGLYRPAIVGDRVWLDQNANGKQESGESGYAGQRVSLLSPAGQVLATQQTDAQGQYRFSNLAPGSYTLLFAAPTALSFSPAQQGVDPKLDSDPAPATGQTPSFQLNSGQEDLTRDAGLYSPGHLSLVKRVSSSSVQPGQTVVYTYTLANTGGVALHSVTVRDDKCSPLSFMGGDQNGDNRLDLGEKWLYTCQTTLSVPTLNRATATARDLGGLALQATDIAFVDVLGSGVHIQKGVDRPILYRGETATYTYLVSNQHGVPLHSLILADDRCSPLQYQSGDGNGNLILDIDEIWRYLCSAALTEDTVNIATVEATPPTGNPLSHQAIAQVDVIAPAIALDKRASVELALAQQPVTYTLDVVNMGDDPLTQIALQDDQCSPLQFRGGDDNHNQILEPGERWSYFCTRILTQTTVNQATVSGVDSLNQTVTATDQATVTLYALAGLGDRVWHDLNANGRQDGGEPGLAGVAVELYNALDQLVDATTTDGQGRYAFVDLTPGAYSVRVLPAAGFLFSPQNQGGAGDVDSDFVPESGRSQPVDLTAGYVEMDVDAGLYQLATLGNRVWEDLDGNGRQDLGEPNLAGVTIRLQDAAGITQAITQTNSQGAYSFNGLAPALYRLLFTPPNTYFFTPPNQGVDRTEDSDPDPITGVIDAITLISGQQDLSRDAGLYRAAQLGDRVWADLDGNGLQGSQEPGLTGVQVALINQSDQTIASMVTGVTGRYFFARIWPGTYTVRFTPPAGYTWSKQAVGADPGVDSDPNPATGQTEIVPLPSGAIDFTIDAGFTPLSPWLRMDKRDSLAEDRDGNGAVSPGDVVAYTIVLENVGNVPATQAAFRDTPDSNTRLLANSVTTTQGDVVMGNEPAATQVVVNIGSIPAGGKVTIRLSVIISENLPSHVTQITNQGVTSSFELADVPTDDGDTASNGDPTGTTVRRRTYFVFMPVTRQEQAPTATPTATPTPLPTQTPQPTPTATPSPSPTATPIPPDDPGIACDPPGCAVPGLAHPKAMAMDISRQALFVVSRDTDLLLKLDPRTLQVLAQAPTGDEPWGVAVNELTGRVYVSNYGDGDVWLYDSDTMQKVGAVTVGPQPAWMEIFPDINTVAVITRGNNGVAIIQGQTLIKVVGSGGAGVYGLAADPVNYRLFVTNRDASTLQVIKLTATGSWTTDGAPSINFKDRRIPFDIVYNPLQQRLYMVYSRTGTWFVDTWFFPADASWTLRNTVTVGNSGSTRDANVGGSGLVFNPVTGHLFNVDTGDNTVTVIDSSGRTVLATIPAGQDPFAATVNPVSGVIFVGLRQPGLIQKIEDNF